jgi:hypothetical protein
MSEEQSRKQSNGQKSTSGLGRRDLLLNSAAIVAAAALGGVSANAASTQPDATPPPPTPAPSKSNPPNILVIFGDDIGQTNISAYSFGVMGYRTPNIDRLAKGEPRGHWPFGANLSPACGVRRCSTCVWTLTNAPRSRPTLTTTICCGGHFSSFRPRPSLGNSSRPSKSFRRDRSPRASASTKSWSSCKSHKADRSKALGSLS